MDAGNLPGSTSVQANTEIKLTPGQHRLTSVGDHTGQVAEQIFKAASQASQEFGGLHKWEDVELIALAEALDRKWHDDKAAVLIAELQKLLASGQYFHLDSQSVVRFVLAHGDDPDKAIDCCRVIPPEGVRILAAKSKRGSQKQVYLASWGPAEREVILKRILGTSDQQQTILGRELQSHPLAMFHPNIIATHWLTNSRDEHFLIEELIPQPLDDMWQANGIHEAANLLYDIARALAYLHDERHLVHGDVKPDNLGRKGNRYLLFDFGICREDTKFVRETTATGSLRTRAPELLSANVYPQEPGKVDVWSLGACVYKAITGRFPFVDATDTVPRITEPEKRAAFIQIIAARMQQEWDARVDLNAIAQPLRSVLQRVLVKDPDQRVSAKELVNLCNQRLGGFLPDSGHEGVTADAELDQMLRYLPRNESLKRMPAANRQQLSIRLRELKKVPRLVEGRENQVEELLKLLE